MTQDLNFIKTRSIKDIIIASSTVLVGALLSFLPENASLVITGYLLLIVGIILFFTLKSNHTHVGTRAVFHKKVKYFDISQKEPILFALENDPSHIDMSLEGKGSGVILDIYYNQQEVYVQAYTFSCGQYEAKGEMLHFEADQVPNLTA